MGLFGKKDKNKTKCDVCDLELPTPERLRGIKRRLTAMFQKKRWMNLVAACKKGECGDPINHKILVDNYGNE